MHPIFLILLLPLLILYILFVYLDKTESVNQPNNLKQITLNKYFKNLLYTGGAIIMPFGITYLSFYVFDFFKGDKILTDFEGGNQDFYYKSGNLGLVCAGIFQFFCLIFLLIFYKKKGRNLYTLILLALVSLIIFGIGLIIISFARTSSSHQWR